MVPMPARTPSPQDYTDMEAALQAAQGRLRSILETVPDAMIIIDERGPHPIVQRDRRAPVRLHGRRRSSAETSAC